MLKNDCIQRDENGEGVYYDEPHSIAKDGQCICCGKQFYHCSRCNEWQTTIDCRQCLADVQRLRRNAEMPVTGDTSNREY